MQPAFVVFTDFSDAAEAAIGYTTRLARLLHGRVVLLHPFHDPLLDMEADMILVPTMTETRKQIKASLVRRARELPVPAAAELAEDTLASMVAGVVEHHQPLLLALGRARANGLPDFLVPNQAAALLRAGRYPLLLVPEEWAATTLPQRVAVAADDHNFWLAEPELALRELFAALQPTTTVVHVRGHAGSSRGAVGLAAVRRTEVFAPVAAAPYEVRAATPADGILQAAADVQAELLVLLARPHTFLGELFHRSVTAQVLRRSPMPVLVLPTA